MSFCFLQLSVTFSGLENSQDGISSVLPRLSTRGQRQKRHLQENRQKRHLEENRQKRHLEGNRQKRHLEEESKVSQIYHHYDDKTQINHRGDADFDSDADTDAAEEADDAADGDNGEVNANRIERSQRRQKRQKQNPKCLAKLHPLNPKWIHR